jgi:excisionase family DNA binding protein
MSRASLEVSILGLCEEYDAEDAVAALSAVKSRIMLREMTRKHLLPSQQDRSQGRLLNVAEVASLLGVSERYVRAHQHELGRVKIGRSVRFHENKIREYIER